MKLWDNIEKNYIKRNGWRLNDEGMLVLTAKQAQEYQYLGRSIRNPEQRTLMISSLHGSTLLFEGRHFIIEG